MAIQYCPQFHNYVREYAPLVPPPGSASKEGPVAFQSFRSLEKSTRTFNLRLNPPSPDHLRPLFGYDYPTRKKQQQKKQAKNEETRIRDLSSGKKSKTLHFCR